jgi:hypothetical protein
MGTKMNEINNSPACERAGDLIAVLYREATEREQRDFELHTQQCASCRAEFAGFGLVRESIRDWRDEALAGFVSSQQTAPAPTRKSAMAALRQFFDLSPLWMKGAVGFAAVVFCLLAVLSLARLGASDRNPQVATENGYTKEDVDRAVQAALSAKEREQQVVQPTPPALVESPAPKTANVAKRKTKSQRPFSRAEREQLAAELRLLSDDEVDMYLWAEPNDK